MTEKSIVYLHIKKHPALEGGFISKLSESPDKNILDDRWGSLYHSSHFELKAYSLGLYDAFNMTNTKLRVIKRKPYER